MFLTRKAVLGLHGFEADTASNSAQAIAHLDSSEYQMVISDLQMETEVARLDRHPCRVQKLTIPATALLTAYQPSAERWQISSYGKLREGTPREGIPRRREDQTSERSAGGNCDSLLIKPLGTSHLLRQVEALLVQQEEKQLRLRNSAAEA